MNSALLSRQEVVKAQAWSSPVATATALFLIGASSLWLYHWARDLHRFIQGISGYTALFIAQFAIYLFASFFALRQQSPRSRKATLFLAAIVLIFAAAFRFDLVAQRPYLSTDVYRYVWDGRVQAAGINPYAYVPSSPELAHLRDTKVFPNINRSDYTSTPYPPGAQMIFLLAYLLHPSSVIGFKVLMTIFDLLAILALMIVLQRVGRPPVQALIFAWHPLVIYEGAHTGHVESGFMVFLALALLAWSYKKPVGTGVALALATLVKFYPAMLLPVFLFSKIGGEDESGNSVFAAAKVELPPGDEALEEKASPARRLFNPSTITNLLNAANLKMIVAFVVTMTLAYMPYVRVGAGGIGSLANEFNEEGFTGKGNRYFLLVLFRHLAPLPTTLFLVAAALAFIGFALYLTLKPRRDVTDVARAAIALIGLYFFLVTPRYHWYYAWILPFLCFAPRLSWLYMTGATVLLYTLWFTPLIYPEIPVWLGLAVYAPTLLFLIVEKRMAFKTFLNLRKSDHSMLKSSS
jgi:alpha-1,6-mannosyltransferase